MRDHSLASSQFLQDKEMQQKQTLNFFVLILYLFEPLREIKRFELSEGLSYRG